MLLHNFVTSLHPVSPASSAYGWWLSFLGSFFLPLSLQKSHVSAPAYILVIQLLITPITAIHVQESTNIPHQDRSCGLWSQFLLVLSQMCSGLALLCSLTRTQSPQLCGPFCCPVLAQCGGESDGIAWVRWSTAAWLPLGFVFPSLTIGKT